MLKPSSPKTWRILWIYLLGVAIWVVLTDVVFAAMSHQLSRATLIFSTIRSVTLYAVTAILLQGLLRRLKRTQQSYLDFIEASPQPLLIQSNQYWIYANSAALRLLGAKHHKQVIGKPIWSIIPPHQRHEVKFKEFAPTTPPLSLLSNRQLQRLDGEFVDVELIVTPLRMAGKLYRQFLYNDVSRRKRAEQELKSALNDLESFIHHNTDAVVLFDKNACVSKVNAAFERLFNIDGNDIVGLYVDDMPIIPDEYRAEAHDLLQKVFAGETVDGHSTIRQTLSGERIYVLLSVFPLRNYNNEVSGWSVTLHDITEYKRAEQRLVQSEKLAAVGQLAAAVAHEIKNPLTTVMGFIDLIKSSPLEKQKQYTDIMTNELQRISTIVNEMLVLSRPQPHTDACVEIQHLLGSVVDLLQPEATMRNVDLCLNVNVADVIPADTFVIIGHENRLKQVLINLVRNAMDALETPPRRVILSSYRQEQNTVIEVQDTGIGLTPEQLAHMGDPFYTTKQDGTGLGLFVCKQIVEEHQGTLQFDSVRGMGTTVRLTLPLRKLSH